MFKKIKFTLLSHSMSDMYVLQVRPDTRQTWNFILQVLQRKRENDYRSQNGPYGITGIK